MYAIRRYYDDGSRLGTYGMIKNAKTFIVAIAKKSLGEDLMRAVDFGYDFEKIVLKATDLGLDTRITSYNVCYTKLLR